MKIVTYKVEVVIHKDIVRFSRCSDGKVLVEYVQIATGVMVHQFHIHPNDDVKGFSLFGAMEIVAMDAGCDDDEIHGVTLELMDVARMFATT